VLADRWNKIAPQKSLIQELHLIIQLSGQLICSAFSMSVHFDAPSIFLHNKKQNLFEISGTMCPTPDLILTSFSRTANKPRRQGNTGQHPVPSS
jgi:hypothetical protein